MRARMHGLQWGIAIQLRAPAPPRGGAFARGSVRVAAAAASELST
eukprot:COSAG05_NODE_14508_length_395_cov_0.581081_1_plen_44_part_10